MPQDRNILSWLRSQVVRPGAFFRNVSWVTLENLFQAVAGLAVAVGIARLLGPDSFGFWTYALAIYALATTVSSLGTEQIVVLDLIKGEKRSQSVLATAAALRLGVSLAAVAAMIGLALMRPAHEADLAAILIVLALTVPLMSVDVTRLWYRSHMRFQVPAITNIAATFAGGTAKIALVVATGSIVLVAVASAVQVVLFEVALLVFFVSAYGAIRLSDIDATYARSLLRACLPILLADLAILVYMRANIFLLDLLRGATEVGIFGAATRISEAAYMIPMIVVTAASPAMYRLYVDDRALFLHRFDQLLGAMTAAMVTLCIVTTFLSPRIISVLFGANFADSAAVLVLHVWTALFVAQGVISGIWLMAEKATMVVLVRTLAGAAINIGLGLLLIPQFGARGAAVATLVAMACSSMIVHVFMGGLGREILARQLRSLLLMSLWPRKVSQ